MDLKGDRRQHCPEVSLGTIHSYLGTLAQQGLWGGVADRPWSSFSTWIICWAICLFKSLFRKQNFYDLKQCVSLIHKTQWNCIEITRESKTLWGNDKTVSVCSHLSVLGYPREGRSIRWRFLPSGVSPGFSCWRTQGIALWKEGREWNIESELGEKGREKKDTGRVRVPSVESRMERLDPNHCRVKETHLEEWYWEEIQIQFRVILSLRFGFLFCFCY